MLVVRHPPLIKTTSRRMIISIKVVAVVVISNTSITIIIINSSIGSSSSSNNNSNNSSSNNSNKMMARPRRPRIRAQVRGIATMETWNNPARAPDVRRAVACRLSFSPPTVTYIFARKPPVAVLLHHQSYQQHQAINTANITAAISNLGEENTTPLPQPQPPPASASAAAAVTTTTTVAATGATTYGGGGMFPQPSHIQHHQHVQHQHVQSPQHQAHIQSHHQMQQHHVPIQNVHVQNIQAQNIQVQNVLVQPSATGAGLEQNIQAQNVQLQMVQGTTGGYLAQGVAPPFSGMQIQNIGAPLLPSQVQTYAEGPVTEAKANYEHLVAEDIKVKVEREEDNKKTDVTMDSKYITNLSSSNNTTTTTDDPHTTTTKIKGANQTTLYHHHSSAVAASSAPTTFQLVAGTSVPTSSAQNYIMAYSHVPAREANVQLIGPAGEGGKTTVLSLSSQPMLVNLEPPQTTSASAQWTMHPVIFSANNVCCLQSHTTNNNNKEPPDVKVARTPVGPTAQLTPHSPQLPQVPSPNYPIQSQLAPDVSASDPAKSESRNIPNRNVPILNNNNYNNMYSGNVHHSEFTSHSTSARALQFSEICNSNNNNNNNHHSAAAMVLGHNQPRTDCRRTNSDNNSCTTTGFIRNNGNGGVVYSEHLSSNNNELFNNNQVANVNEVNCSDNNNKVNVKSEATCTQAHTKQGHDRATPITSTTTTTTTTTTATTTTTTATTTTTQQQQSKDYESLITINQIVNTNLQLATNLNIVIPTPPPPQQHQPPIVVEKTTAATAFTVLNVPSVGRFKIGNDLSEQQRPLVSKLDVATAKRRERRLKRRLHRKPATGGNVQQHCIIDSDSSFCSSSNSDSEDGINARVVDLWITSGPPDKPDYKPDKLKFLNIFGLTTHVDKNEVELAKLERRTWQAPWKAMLPDEGQQPPCLDLPVPESHPTLLNHTPDFGAKVNFFCELGLRTMSDRSREELETTWQKIIENRQKRDGETALTTYCVRAYRKMRNHAGAVVQVPRISDMRHNGQQHAKQNSAVLLPSVETTLLSFSQQPRHTFSSSSLSAPGLPPLPNVYKINNGLKRSMDAQAYAATVKRMSLEHHHTTEHRCDANEVKQIANTITATKNASTATDKEKLKWPGIPEVMESYHKYNKERTVEMKHLRTRCSYLSDQIRRRQTEADVLERKLRELRSLHIFHDQERQQIQRSVDQLKSVLHIFR